VLWGIDIPSDEFMNHVIYEYDESS